MNKKQLSSVKKKDYQRHDEDLVFVCYDVFKL